MFNIPTLSLIIFFCWIYILLFHGRKKILTDSFFWTNPVFFEEHTTKNINSNKKGCVIIPARNEEKYILKTLESIRRQNLKKLDVIVVNDNSTDQTKFLANKFKTVSKKLIVIDGKKLPKGWVGKVWALKQGVDIANKKNYDYYVFLDADIYLEKGVIEKTLSLLIEKKLTMLSLMAKLKCESFWEKLLVPSFIFYFQKLYPFEQVNSTDEKTAAAAGGFILCKSEIFKKQNQYNLIKNKIIDDCNIAKKIKSKGAIWLGLTNLVRSERSYNQLESLWKMVSRTAFEQLNFSLIILIISSFSMFMIYVAPFILFFTYWIFFDLKIFIINLLTLTLITVAFFPTFKFYNVDKKFLFLIPLSSLLYILMTVSSAINFYFKEGTNWKGRSY